MIELPRIAPSLRHRRSGAGADSHVAVPAWSAADELAALETVWESLCNDAQSTRPSPELPSFRRSRQVRALSIPLNRALLRQEPQDLRRVS